MVKVFRPLLILAFAGVTCTAAQAQLSLPGKTLRTSDPEVRGGKLQPAKNPKNIAKGIVTPPCPHVGKSLRALMVYARANHPGLYRQAVAMRRTGFTQEQTRLWLEGQICSTEGV